MFQVKWTGSYPCLCCGEWRILKNGIDVSQVIPNDITEMNTYGIYQSWHFDDNWIEVFEDYEDGLECDDWIKANAWIDKICDSYDEKVELFKAIQEQDFRTGSCGGCI